MHNQAQYSQGQPAAVLAADGEIEAHMPVVQARSQSAEGSGQAHIHHRRLGSTTQQLQGTVCVGSGHTCSQNAARTAGICLSDGTFKGGRQHGPAGVPAYMQSSKLPTSNEPRADSELAAAAGRQTAGCGMTHPLLGNLKQVAFHAWHV